VLDIKWKDGKLQQVIIRSKAGMPLTLRYHNKVISMATTKNKVYKFDGALKKI
jgi:alpha-L-fucosidase 2